MVHFSVVTLGATVASMSAGPAALGVNPTQCRVDDQQPNEQYPSRWNQTTNRVCKGAVETPVCILGAGMAGVHLGWLMARRGFRNVTIFESEDHVGGKAWTITGGVGGDGVTRDVGAEFVSPDYYETMGLIKRFNLTLLPLSSSRDSEIHLANGTVTSGSAWYNARVANITGSTDPVANGRAVNEALGRYTALHRSIFGQYTGRMPSQPTPAAMELIRGTVMEFLQRNNLDVLEPLFFNIFVMQGQGLLTDSPAWYALRWVNPALLAAPPFDDNPDTPAAVIKEGMGGIVQHLLADVSLNLQLSTRVTSIARTPSGVTVSHEPSSGGGPTRETACDFVVLTGPVPRFVRGSEDGATAAILQPTPAELEIFGPMTPMQYLETVAELQPAPLAYRAVEYWPGGTTGMFNTTAGVVVRRNIEFVETNRSGPLGGIMSYSYWPAPQSNRTTHWDITQRWAAEQGFAISKVYVQLWVDTYSYHYRNFSDIASGKPWRVWQELQLDPDTRTIYAGGAANYESIEDTLYFNLYLAHRLFDAETGLHGGDMPDAAAEF
eukprot:m.446452 g.446452  ORF g.446452 m.446452 type:complete len:550 (+) comp19364_c0_seq1:3311-4960(+)